MKLSCTQENLSKGLATAGRAVPTRTALPAALNILLSTDGEKLRISGTNLEISMTTWIAASVDEEGTVAVPAKVLSDFVNSLPAGRIDLEVEPKNHVLKLDAGKSTARIHGMDPEEFPKIPTMENAMVAQADSAAFKASIGKVAFASAVDDTRAVLNGIDLKLEKDRVTFAAADGFRLAVCNGFLTKEAPEDIEVIIPTRALTELQRVLGGPDETVDIMLTPESKQVMFKVGSAEPVELISQLMQGSFPDYRQLIPQTYATRTILDTQQTLRATRTASIFARESSNIVRFTMDPGDQTPQEEEAKEGGAGEGGAGEDGTEEGAGEGAERSPGRLTISAESADVGDNHDEIKVIGMEGETSKIAFNSKYLLDVLGAMEKGQTVLETSTPSSPGTFKPMDSDDYIVVVMPMFVQW